jgi:glycosyltransferase involved in cell wall biosynthesis
VVVVAQELTPYRLHFHRRLLQEIPDLRLATVLINDTAISPWGALDSPDMEIHRFSEGEKALGNRTFAKFLFRWRKAARVIRYLNQHRPDAVLAIGYSEWSLLRPILWANRRRVPCFLWADSNIRGDRATGLRRFAKRLLISRVISRCSGVLPCGRLGEQFFERYGIPRDRMILAPCEPDYEQIESLPQVVIDAVRGRYALRSDRRRILFCGRLAPAKRPDIALAAFLEIADERPDWDIVFAGDGPMREHLRSQIPDHLCGRVFMTGFIGRQDEVTALYHLCDILLHPADWEPWALVINEAVAAGLALVVSDVTGAAVELVCDGVNGRLLPPGDPAQYAAALREVTEPETLETMRQASKVRLQEWRRAADPVAGLRLALEKAGVLRPGQARAGYQPSESSPPPPPSSHASEGAHSPGRPAGSPVASSSPAAGIQA